MKNRRVRFKIKGEWTEWYGDDADLSFLNNNCDVQAMEETCEMSKAEWAKLEDSINQPLLPKVDSEGLRQAAKEGHARVSSVVNVTK